MAQLLSLFWVCMHLFRKMYVIISSLLQFTAQYKLTFQLFVSYFSGEYLAALKLRSLPVMNKK